MNRAPASGQRAPAAHGGPVAVTVTEPWDIFAPGSSSDPPPTPRRLGISQAEFDTRAALLDRGGDIESCMNGVTRATHDDLRYELDFDVARTGTVTAVAVHPVVATLAAPECLGE